MHRTAVEPELFYPRWNDVLELVICRVGKDDWIEKCSVVNKDLDWNLTWTSLSDIPEAFIAGNNIEWKTVTLSGNILYPRLPYPRLQLYGFCLQFPLWACERSFSSYTDSWLNL